MKFLRPEKALFYFIVLFICLNSLNAQNIEIKYNFETAEKLIEIFDKGELTKKDFQELIKLDGTKAYLKKLSSFFEGINKNSFEQSLKAAVSKKPLLDDPYLLGRIISELETTKKFISRLKKEENQIQKSTVTLLKPYIPKELKIKINVNLIIGVVGGGWTFDEQPNTFYVDITSLKGDFIGLQLLSSHEIYHLIQYRFMKKVPKKSGNRLVFILDQIVREGSAVYIADFSKVNSKEGKYINFSKREYRRNFRRMKSNFALFEILVQQIHQNKSVSIDEVYNIGFSGQYQSPLYYVGYHIIKVIEKYKGKNELLKLLKKSPINLFITYNKLSDKYKNTNKDIIQISNSTLKILNSINQN